jgi:opacity protein-like surface antigen
MRKILILFGLVLFVATCARAQEGPNFEVSGDYQYVRLYPGGGAPAQGCQGFSGNAAGNVNRWVGIVGDFGYCGVTGLPSGTSSHATNFLFGPRVSFRNYGRVTPYAQFLFGGDHATVKLTSGGTTTSTSANAFAFTLGGGFDIRLSPNVSLRAIQFEYFDTHFNSANQKNLRIQTGLVYRFGGK